MFAKVLALIAELKAAGVAVVVIAGAATATVAGTNAEFQTTFQQLTTNIRQSHQGLDPSFGPGHLWLAHATPTGYGAP